MVDSLLRLRHHIVVSGDDDDSDVRDLRTTSTHSGEGFVTWRIEEGNALTTLEADAVGTDMLGDPPCFTSDDVGIAQAVEERRLTVVDVTHDGDDRRTADEVSFVIDLFFLRDGFDDLSADEVGLVAEFFCDHLDGLSVEAHIDRHHQTDAHTGSDDLRHGDVHEAREVTHRHELSELQRTAFGFATLLSVESCRASGVTLVLTVLSGLRTLLVLTRQTSKRLLDLTLYIFISDDTLLRLLTLTLGLTAGLLLGSTLLGIATTTAVVGVCGATITTIAIALAGLLRAIVRHLSGFGLDIDGALTDTGALTALVGSGLLSGARIIVDRRKVDLTYYVEADPCTWSRRAIDLGLAHRGLFSCGSSLRLGLRCGYCGCRIGSRSWLRFGLRISLRGGSFDLRSRCRSGLGLGFRLDLYLGLGLSCWCRSLGLRSGSGLRLGLRLGSRLGFSLLLRGDGALDIEAGAAILGDDRLDVLHLRGSGLSSGGLGLSSRLGRRRLSSGTTEGVEERGDLGLAHALAVLSDELLGHLAGYASVGGDSIDV